MYDEWTEKSVYLSLSYGRLLAQHHEIERKIKIMQAMAEELLELGVENFQKQNTFPMGRYHFSQMVYVLAKVAGIKKEI